MILPFHSASIHSFKGVSLYHHGSNYRFRNHKLETSPRNKYETGAKKRTLVDVLQYEIYGERKSLFGYLPRHSSLQIKCLVVTPLTTTRIYTFLPHINLPPSQHTSSHHTFLLQEAPSVQAHIPIALSIDYEPLEDTAKKGTT